MGILLRKENNKSKEKKKVERDEREKEWNSDTPARQ